MNKTTNGAADHPDGSARVVDVNVRQQLDALLAGMDSRLAELRADATRFEGNLVVKRALCEALPAGMPLAPDAVKVGDQVYKGDAEMSFSVTSRAQALELMETLPGLPVLMVKGGCTTFIPEESFIEDGRGAKVVPVGDVVYRFSTWCGSLQEEYCWWTRLAGKLVNIKAHTRKGAQPEAQARGHSRDISPTEVETIWEYSRLPSGEVMRWYGGNRTTVAPLTVHQARGVAFKDAAVKTQTTTAKVRADRCAC